MNPEKSEVKLAIIHDHGERVERRLEQCRMEGLATEAAIQVLTLTRKEIQTINGSIEVETRAGQLSPAHAVIARKYVKKCVDFIENFLKGTEMKLFVAKGRSEALTELMAEFKAEQVDEHKKLDGFKESQARALEELKALEEERLRKENDLPIEDVDVDISELDVKVEPKVKPKKIRPIRMDVARSLGIDTKKRRG